MSVFSDAELTYLAKGKLGRLATIDGAGMPHVVPLGWRYNPELDTIDIGGRDFARTRKFRNAERNPNVALVVDDVLPPWRPRCVLVRGRAEALADATGQTANWSDLSSGCIPPRWSAGEWSSPGNRRVTVTATGAPVERPRAGTPPTPRRHSSAKPAPAAA